MKRDQRIVVIVQAPDGSTWTASVRKCAICGCLVASVDNQEHTEWHHKITSEIMK